MTVYSVVNSLAANFPAVKRVQILIEDRPAATLAGHVDLTRPLRPDMTLLATAPLTAGGLRAARSERPAVGQGRALHRVGHPRDDAAGAPARRREPVAGLSRLPGARGGQGGGAPRGRPTTSTSTRSPGARGSLRQAIAAKFERLYGVPVDPEREVTVTCGSTEAMIADPARRARPRRRGRGLRALLRELRPGRHPLRRAAALRAPAAAGLVLRPRRAARGPSARARARSS